MLLSSFYKGLLYNIEYIKLVVMTSIANCGGLARKGKEQWCTDRLDCFFLERIVPDKHVENGQHAAEKRPKNTD